MRHREIGSFGSGGREQSAASECKATCSGQFGGSGAEKAYSAIQTRSLSAGARPMERTNASKSDLQMAPNLGVAELCGPSLVLVCKVCKLSTMFLTLNDFGMVYETEMKYW